MKSENTVNYVYIHVCCINNWKQVFTMLLNKIKTTGLYDNIREIRCGILGKYDIAFFNDPKINIIYNSSDMTLYETPTINLLHQHSLEEDFNVLYIHTKGVKTNGENANVNDWTNYLCYFNIGHHATNVRLLHEYDCVGVNLQGDSPFHYSGNYWWSKSQYIRNLEKCVYTQYCSPEFWLTEKKLGTYVSLWNSNVNHYHQSYSEDNYVNKDIYPVIHVHKL